MEITHKATISRIWMGIKIKEVIKEPIIGKIITKIMKTNRMQTMKMKDETDKHQTKEKDKIMRIKHQKIQT